MEQCPCKVSEVRQPITFLSSSHKNQELMSKLWNHQKSNFFPYYFWFLLCCLNVVTKIIELYVLLQQHSALNLLICAEETVKIRSK